MEDADILRTALVESPFERDVIDISTRFVTVVVSVCVDTPTYNHIEPIAEEPFGELERIVGPSGSIIAFRLLHTHTHVHIHHTVDSLSCDVVDFVLQEVVQGVRRTESTLIGARQIHTGCKQGDSQLVLVFCAHTGQLVLDRDVFWCIDGEFQSHVLQRVEDPQSHIEQY